MPTLRKAKTRHAEYYLSRLTHLGQQYRQGAEARREGLATFNQDAAQIDAARTWVQDQATQPNAALDELLVGYADQAAHIAPLRYNIRTEWLPWLKAALSAAQRLNKPEAQAALLTSLGGAYETLGEYAKARQEYRKALRIVRRLHSRRVEGHLLNNLCSVYKETGHSRQAFTYGMQALLIARESGDQPTECLTLGNLGHLYLQREKYKRAFELYDQCLDLALQLRDRHLEGLALSSLGTVARRQGDFESALSYFRQSLQCAVEMKDQAMLAMVSWNAGLLLGQFGYLKEATELMEVCLEYEEAIGHAELRQHQTRVLSQKMG